MKDQTTILRLLAEGVRLGSARRLLLPRDSMRGAAGGRLGVSAGSSLDFHDYREYHPGDDLRHLDWGVYARSDKEIVKLYITQIGFWQPRVSQDLKHVTHEKFHAQNRAAGGQGDDQKIAPQIRQQKRHGESGDRGP